MAAGRLQQGALLRQVCSQVVTQRVCIACERTSRQGPHTGSGVQVFAQVAKKCLHSPLAERAAGGQCSTSSAVARSAKLQRRPYNFFRDEVPADPQAQVRLRRLLMCYCRTSLLVYHAETWLLCGILFHLVQALGAQPHTV